MLNFQGKHSDKMYRHLTSSRISYKRVATTHRVINTVKDEGLLQIIRVHVWIAFEGHYYHPHGQATKESKKPERRRRKDRQTWLHWPKKSGLHSEIPVTSGWRGVRGRRGGNIWCMFWFLKQSRGDFLMGETMTILLISCCLHWKKQTV